MRWGCLEVDGGRRRRGRDESRENLREQQREQGSQADSQSWLNQPQYLRWRGAATKIQAKPNMDWSRRSRGGRLAYLCTSQKGSGASGLGGREPCAVMFLLKPAKFKPCALRAKVLLYVA